jgi:diphosphomevalonate decarboxylase
MSINSATAIAHPNIAFIKYWGNRDHTYRLPENGSISLNLAELVTQTRVTFDPALSADIFDLNNLRQTGTALQRVTSHLNIIRGLRGIATRAHVMSENNFPAGAGIASSASAFAALTVAAVNALNLEMSEKDLSRLARRGSGSACRSIPAGFVEWYRGTSDLDSFAISIARPAHWNLVDCIAIVETGHKKTGSTEGHKLASSSLFQPARIDDAPRRIDRCRDAILNRDFESFAEIIEADSNMMHAVMMTSRPALFYWEPVTIEIMKAVQTWRKTGVPAAYTIDAGPNVHILCESSALDNLTHRLTSIQGIKEILVSKPGGGTKTI